MLSLPINVSKFNFMSDVCAAIADAHKMRLRTSCRAPWGVSKWPGANCMVVANSCDSTMSGLADSKKALQKQKQN